MAKKKYIIIILIIIAIIGIYFSLHYQADKDNYKQDEFVDSKQSQSESQPDKKLKDIRLSFYNNDQTICWELDSEDVADFTKNSLLELAPVSIQAFDAKKKLLYLLSAKEGVYLSALEKLNLTSLIKINKDDFWLEMGKLSWQKRDDLIIGTGGIGLSSPSFILTGDRLEADLALKRLIIYGNKEKQAYFSWRERG